ncbi:MAG: glycosyltransferase family 4 protein [Desulfuromonadaceae bacterium]|nr:glycosyltransferase family 4 protein [Desulfuromonadaceae bacterium]MDD2848565.1 glycosyltransferase family 4 protein [Desulfuromonadaceae bacterium]MDD4131533.1 glycosyltransferase family 4 protein [Desulfuromonadaceae bacterium]
MHVLYFHQHFSTPAGSTGTRSYEMAQRLIARGHKVTMVCGSGQMASSGLQEEPVNGMRKGTVDNIDVVEFCLPYSNYDSFLKRSWIFVLFAWRSVKLALQLRYDLLFATSTPLTAGIPGIVASVLRRKRFVFEVRDLWPELPREMGVITNPMILAAMSALEWLSYHTAHACIGLSPGIVQGIVRLGIHSEKVGMIPNGCDLDLFNPDNGEFLRPVGVDKDDFVAIFSGAHGIANGLDAVLDAAAELKRKGRNDIKLVFIGDGRLKPALVKRATDEALDNCLFLNPVPKMKLTAYLRGADAGLMILDNIPAFYYGTSPNKFFDYIAIGLPVINNYPGWLAGIITENSCGCAVEPENPKSFAESLEKLADNPELAKQMGINARALAVREFNRKDLGDMFVDFLEKAYQH